MSEEYKTPKLDKATVQQVSSYLFQDPKNDSDKFLDTRTDIQGKNTFSALLFYRLLGECFTCSNAKVVADIIERLSISKTRKGREEAVTVLQGNLPKTQKVMSGTDGMSTGESQG
jgi:hypothetical protein